MYKQRQLLAGWFLRGVLVGSLACGVSTWAWAQGGTQGNASQSPPPKSAPSPADLEPLGGSQRRAKQVGSQIPVESIEPGVNTSAIQPSSSETPASSAAPPTPSAVPSAPQSTPKAAAVGKAVAVGKKASGSEAATTSASAAKSSAPAGKAHDSIQLDETQITGNRELPKVLYIVPWKRSDLGDLVGKPVNSLVDEVLAPVDRDVFKRQNRYYDALKPDAAKESAGAGAKP
jgi:hypothetical protein